MNAQLDLKIQRLRSAISANWQGDTSTLEAELAIALAEKRNAHESKAVGPFSGLSRRELAMSRTCETDWF